MEVFPREEKHVERLTRHMVSELVCMGRHTVTNLLATGGRQHVDWTSDYRMYGKGRIRCENLQRQVTKEVCALTDSHVLVTALDDSLLPKTGKKIPGVKYARDPMGPPFHVNFRRGQRVIQMSAAVSDGLRATMVPVIFRDAATADKPKRNAPEDDWAAYKEESKVRRLSVQGAGCIAEMRSRLGKDKALWVTVDGSYTNRTVLNNLPQDTVLIGRIRSDAKLYHLPDSADQAGIGRRRIYGAVAPSPEAVRLSEEVSWQIVKAYTAGKEHEFKVKVVKYLRWRGSGKQHTVQLMVIAPLRYRLTVSSRLLYRDPAYLICTDPLVPAEKMLQAYLWRWGIETNFRDEKTILGTGEAQVRNSTSVKAVPQMTVAAYSLLLLAGIKLWGVSGLPPALDLPKWRDVSKKTRVSTCDLIKELRRELWSDSITSHNFSHFVSKPKHARSPLNIRIPAFSAVLQINPS